MKTLSWILIFFGITTKLLAQSGIDTTDVYSFKYNGVKYQIILENKDWQEAAKCADELGGILAEINSPEEQDTLFFHLNNAGINVANTVAPDGGNASYVWLGGNDIIEEGKWIWDGANYGFGAQFWQGVRDGSPIGGLFNNWGNEPDNFSNQDGLGLAITNWPFGDAGQWNDVNASNELYFVIEYDFSTIKINNTEYDYDSKNIRIQADLIFDYDSVQIFINDTLYKTLQNITSTDSILTALYPVSETKQITVQLYAFRQGNSAKSRIFPLQIFTKNNPVFSYNTDFEEEPLADFMSDGFEIAKPFGFLNKAVHSLHDYDLNKDYTYTLLHPIIVSDSDAIMSYSDVAIVEPGEDGSVFGEMAYKDYIVLEGSKKLGNWFPLADGYDATLYDDWKNAWDSGALYRKLYKTHILNLLDTFNAGDTILLRFRLHSDAEVTGWGWTMDSLQIQDFTLAINESSGITPDFELKQNYPNPFNPSTVIEYNLPENSKINLSIYNLLGQKIVTLISGQQTAGSTKVIWDAADYSAGLYFYTLQTDNGWVQTRKLLLLK